MKTCSACKKLKATGEFYEDKSKVSKLSSRCIDCCKESSRRQRERTSVEVRRKYAETYRMNHKEVIAHRNRKWREDNIEDRLLAEAQRRARNKEAIRAQNSIWSRSDKGRMRKRVNSQKRRSVVKGVDMDLSSDYWNELKSYYGAKCMKCGSSDDLTHDHIAPLSWTPLGGHTYINSQILCMHDNSSKKDYWSIDFTDRSVPVLGSDEISYSTVNLLQIERNE